MPTMSFEWVGGVCVVVHAAVEPSDEEWGSYCDALLREGRCTRGQLIWSPGSEPPTAAQRERVRRVWAQVGEAPPMALMFTDSTLLRGVVTALNWFLSQRLKPFAPTDFEGALEYLGVEAGQRRAVLDNLAAQAARLGLSAKLAR